ncbi:MAG TPA: diguanylate cyclase [Dokdonella sp.]|uniref:GGDEF domain-containing protein n=1 Tax=Dokdonella sp. TaxID=2291710 RepID=UPI002D810480|nr:diguanylate cyclase [Dokdonella sp.]HET9033946.1 diguanylate cyclase [Dokdonella sp.]
MLNLESTRSDFFTREVCSVFDAIALQIAGAVRLALVVNELEVANQKLLQLSKSDGLTGIANRRCFDEELKKAWNRHLALDSPLSLLLADVDCFKLLNDSHGHQHGDECLRLLAQHCAGQFEAADLVARFGGEEFAVILPGRDLAGARHIAEQLRRSIVELGIEHPTSPIAHVVTASIGVASVQPSTKLTCEALVGMADKALYLAKGKGRNTIVARSVPQC